MSTSDEDWLALAMSADGNRLQRPFESHDLCIDDGSFES
jgi:hypothetical protein